MNTNTHKVTVGKVVQYLILILMFLLPVRLGTVPVVQGQG